MRIFLHDNTPVVTSPEHKVVFDQDYGRYVCLKCGVDIDTTKAPHERHGERGPTHAGTVNDIDFEYQVEQWVIDIQKDYPHIVRIECPDLVCEWNRNAAGVFVRTSVNS